LLFVTKSSRTIVGTLKVSFEFVIPGSTSTSGSSSSPACYGYPYLYLAAEAFLPGYNFPRLPLRALLPVEDKLHIVDRPRFLGIGESGPRNVLYHEGRKYRMSRCVLPIGGVESRLKKAKFCMMCGYFHDEEYVAADVCDHCKASLTGDSSEFVPRLFEMTTVRRDGPAAAGAPHSVTGLGADNLGGILLRVLDLTLPKHS
jgi:hypothetical protein